MLKGSMVAIPTPMEEGVYAHTALDKEAMMRLVEFHINNESDAIVAVGTTGESATLNTEEHCQVIQNVVEIVAGRLPVIAGTGANSTTEALLLTEAAKEAGADACLLVTPYYNKPTQDGLYLHYRTIAQSVEIPQILYNVPGRTACDLLPETIGRLSKCENIIGVKEATGDVERVDRIRELCGEDFLLVSGDDATSCDFILRGGDGVITVAGNVAPKAMHDMCVAAKAGDRAEARRIDTGLTGLYQELFCESNPIPVKWALNRMGLLKKGIRLPLTWMQTQYEEHVLTAMRQAGVLESNK